MNRERSNQQKYDISDPERCNQQKYSISDPERCNQQKYSISDPERCDQQKYDISDRERCDQQENDISDRERFDQQKDFILEIDKEKNILRQTHLSGHGRRENDAEHAWHMALMVWLLKEYANEEIDIARTMLMCLIHDIVEIDAGDTYAYDEEGKKTQKAREDLAKERIFSLLPPDQKEALVALYDEFEDYETPESCFAHAMDNLQPFLLNDSNGGSDWVEHGIAASQIWGRQEKTEKGSAWLREYIRERIVANIEKGSIVDDRTCNHL